MAEYKARLLKGLFSQSKNIITSDGSDLETSIASKTPVIKAVESNDASVMVAWLTAHNTEIPIGSSIIDFRYATGVCSKPVTAVGRIRFTSYYSSLDNKSTFTTDGTWSAIS